MDVSYFESAFTADEPLLSPLDKNFVETVNQVSMFENFFHLSLMTRPNKLEHLSLETLSSQVLEFEGKARANPIGAPFRCFLFGHAP
jgi:hypothetical protein